MLNNWTYGWLGQPRAETTTSIANPTAEQQVSPMSSTSFRTAQEGYDRGRRELPQSPPKIQLVDPDGEWVSPSIPSTNSFIQHHPISPPRQLIRSDPTPARSQPHHSTQIPTVPSIPFVSSSTMNRLKSQLAASRNPPRDVVPPQPSPYPIRQPTYDDIQRPLSTTSRDADSLTEFSNPDDLNKFDYRSNGNALLQHYEEGDLANWGIGREEILNHAGYNGSGGISGDDGFVSQPPIPPPSTFDLSRHVKQLGVPDPDFEMTSSVQDGWEDVANNVREYTVQHPNGLLSDDGADEIRDPQVGANEEFPQDQHFQDNRRYSTMSIPFQVNSDLQHSSSGANNTVYGNYHPPQALTNEETLHEAVPPIPPSTLPLFPPLPHRYSESALRELALGLDATSQDRTHSTRGEGELEGRDETGSNGPRIAIEKGSPGVSERAQETSQGSEQNGRRKGSVDARSSRSDRSPANTNLRTARRIRALDVPATSVETVIQKGQLLIPPPNFTSLGEISKLLRPHWISIRATLTNHSLSLHAVIESSGLNSTSPPLLSLLLEDLEIVASPSRLPNRKELFPFILEMGEGESIVLATESGLEWLSWTTAIRDSIDLARGRAPRDLENNPSLVFHRKPKVGLSSSSSSTTTTCTSYSSSNLSSAGTAPTSVSGKTREKRHLDKLNEIVEKFDQNLSSIDSRPPRSRRKPSDQEYRRRGEVDDKRKDRMKHFNSDIQVRAFLEEIPHDSGPEEWGSYEGDVGRPEVSARRPRRLDNALPRLATTGLGEEEIGQLRAIYQELARQNDEIDGKVKARKMEVETERDRIGKLRESIESKLEKGEMSPGATALLDQLEYLETLNETRLRRSPPKVPIGSSTIRQPSLSVGEDGEARALRENLERALYPNVDARSNNPRSQPLRSAASLEREDFLRGPPFPPASDPPYSPPFDTLDDATLPLLDHNPNAALRNTVDPLGVEPKSRFSLNSSEENRSDSPLVQARLAPPQQVLPVSSKKDKALVKQPKQSSRRAYHGPPLEELLSLYNEQQRYLERNRRFNRELSSAIQALSSGFYEDRTAINETLRTLAKGQKALQRQKLVTAADHLPGDLVNPRHSPTVNRSTMAPARLPNDDSRLEPPQPRFVESSKKPVPRPRDVKVEQSMEPYHYVPGDGRMADRAVPLRDRELWTDEMRMAIVGGGKKRVGGVRVFGGPEPVSTLHHGARWRDGLEASRRARKIAHDNGWTDKKGKRG